MTRIFGHKQQELQEGGRTLHNAELYNLCCSLYRLICHGTSSGLKWVGKTNKKASYRWRIVESTSQGLVVCLVNPAWDVLLGSGTETLYWGFLLMLNMVIGTFATNGTLSSWRGRTFDQMDGGDLSHEWHDRVGWRYIQPGESHVGWRQLWFGWGWGRGGGVWTVSLILIIPWHLPYKWGTLQKTCQSVWKVLATINLVDFFASSQAALTGLLIYFAFG